MAMVKVEGFVAVVRNARAIPITEEFIDPEHPMASDTAFRACHSWRFAVMLAETDMLKAPADR